MVQHPVPALPIVLLTTCHLQTDGIEDLERLVGSVDSAKGGEEIARLQHIILIQGCARSRSNELKRRLPKWVDVLTVAGRLSSPDARNQLIRHLVQRDDFDPNAVVGFPDDDAWYPPGSLSCVAQHFQKATLGLLLSHYGPNPSADACSRAFRPTLQQVLSRSACAAIFIRARLLAEVGGFSGLLGLGTALKGGEDTEFAHRAFHLAAGRVLCVPGCLVGHNAAPPSKKSQYYEGGLAAIFAHRRASLPARVALARKLAVGVWLVLRGRLTVSNYVGAVRKAVRYADAILERGAIDRSID